MERPKSNWGTYHERTQERPPSRSLVHALEYAPSKDAALDLGAGSLRDSAFLLKSGFARVTAVDSEPSMQERADQIQDPRLEAVISDFQSYAFPANTFDLINAQYALPFTPPEAFFTVFAQVRNSLKEHGVFVGQLFGKNDTWAARPAMTFHTREEVEALLNGMEIIELNEIERDGNTVMEAQKHWHVFDITARK